MLGEKFKSAILTDCWFIKQILTNHFWPIKNEQKIISCDHTHNQDKKLKCARFQYIQARFMSFYTEQKRHLSVKQMPFSRSCMSGNFPAANPESGLPAAIIQPHRRQSGQQRNHRNRFGHNQWRSRACHDNHKPCRIL